MHSALLVVGTPGVGKSALSQDLALKLHLQRVDIGDLVRKERLHKGFDSRTKSYVVDEQRVRRRLQGLIRNTVVVISTHSVGKTISPSWVKLVIVLRLDPVILYHRLRARKWTRLKAWENVESELVDVCLEEAVRLFGRERVFEIDTTSKSSLRVLSETLRVVRGEARSGILRTDWLSKYDPLVLQRKLGWRSFS